MTHIETLTINWHILENCNFDCSYCFAKYGKVSGFSKIYNDVLPQIAKLAGRKITLRDHEISVNRVRINFAGGEPFLAKHSLGHAIDLAHRLGLQPSFISNGILVTDEFIKQFGSMISVAGFSADSFDRKTNAAIGRQENGGRQLGKDRLLEIFSHFRRYSPQSILKINTVVCQENAQENMSCAISELRPERWKLLRVIPIFGAKGRPISDSDFSNFISRHRDLPTRIVIEENEDMHYSYLMLDPSGRFYQRNGSGYSFTRPIMDIGIFPALREVKFDTKAYLSRY